MKKRVWAIVCLTLFITAQTLTNIKIMASTIDSFGQELLDYMTLESMSIALTEGAELDWSDLDLGDALISTEEKARRMLSYYRNKAWQLEKNGLLGIVDMMSDVSVSEAQTPAIAFTLNSGLSNSTINSLYNQVSNNALGISNDDYTLLMNNPTVAFWNRYNNLYLNQYLEDLKYDSDSENVPTPVVPLEYSWFSNCNDMYVGTQSIFNDSLSVYNQEYNYDMTKRVNLSEVTLVCNNDMTNWHTSGNSSTLPGISIADEILTINITTTGNDVVITYPNIIGAFFTSDRYGNGVGKFNLYSINNDRYNIGGMTYLNNTSIPIPSTTQFNNLQLALEYLYAHYINFNLYVDNVLWLQAGLPSATGWNVSIPDAVTDTGTDDGKIVAAPIFWAVDESTGHNVDEWQINLTNMMQKIIDKIDAGQTTLSMQDLVDADAVEGTDGVAIGIGTGVVAGTKSLADAIAQARDVSITDNPAITLEGVAAEAVPGLPSLPVMPANMPGFGGVTVLARIVNFANQSLPTELIVTFWGVVFGAVVLGIIKVLHK